MNNINKQYGIVSLVLEDIINKDYQFEGLMDLTKIHEWLSIPNMQFYFCGPLPFMQSVAKQLIALGIESDKLHYECFGPLILLLANNSQNR